MKVLFLDIDGVLNDHTCAENNYCGIQEDKVRHLNYILNQVPDLQLVISSAWRYQILCGDVSLKGFEMMLLTHGIDCYGRLAGHTPSDEEIRDGREYQIIHYIHNNPVTHFAVVDDLDLAIQNFVKTDPKVGLTRELAEEIIQEINRGSI